MGSQLTATPTIAASRTIRNGQTVTSSAALSTTGSTSNSYTSQTLAAGTTMSRSTHHEPQTQRNPYSSSTTTMHPMTTFQSNISVPQHASNFKPTDTMQSALFSAPNPETNESSVTQTLYIPNSSTIPMGLQSDMRVSTPILPYAQLYDKLLRAIRDRDLYERLYRTTYVVQLQQIGPKLHFNIEKQKKKQNLTSLQRSKGEEKVRSCINSQ
jgi:hypothetical protein